MTAGSDEPYARFDSFDGRGRSWELASPLGVVEAWRLSEVEPALRRVQDEVARGAYAGGFVAYEAAAGLDPTLTTRPPRTDLPLVWFALFGERREGIPPISPTASAAELVEPWRPGLDPQPYAERVEAIRELIAAGDTYQVNLTFPLHSTVSASDLELYASLGRAQRAGYCALLRLPGRSILSISPELFFRWSGGNLELRPMKGTRPRGRWSAEDRALAAALHASEKDRAENLMIVDLLRNDAGRVAEFGSVEVTRLFDVEAYPTVHQLTSTIMARVRPEMTLVDLFRALFPSGSVTGAPKVRTMQIISELEETPRGVYAGAVGLISPEEAIFNVPIRTLVLARNGAAELSVGSGVTYDSRAGDEYRECLQKAAFTQHTPRTFSLLETLLFDPDSGFVLLDRHMTRLTESAEYFGYPVSVEAAVGVLRAAVAGCDEPRRVRLLLSGEGNLTVELSPLAETPEPLQARIALAPVDSSDPFLYHKTTLREPYEERLGERPGFDEVLLVNERGELTEFANGNLVVRIDGTSWTPPLRSGLLPGVMREELMARGELQERVLRPEDLEGAEEVYRINSVRGWTEVRL